jgi:rhodanese-related sulfurtransferase
MKPSTWINQPNWVKMRTIDVRTIYRFLLLSCIWMLVAHSLPLLAGASEEDVDKLETVYAMFAGYKKEFPGVNNIAPEKAAALFARDQILFVDVRKPAEIAVSTLPGAIDKLSFLKNPQKYRDKIVIAFCTIGYRSGLFAQEMAGRGVEVNNLSGGILAWVLKGGKVYNEDGITKRLHVYGPKWDLAPSDYETIKFDLLERLSP